MHITTQTEHPQHIAEVNGVGLTDTAPKVVEALIQLNNDASTGEITDHAHLRDRTEAYRSLKRLHDANVVKKYEADVELKGTARKPNRWQISNKAFTTGVAAHLRDQSDVPLDPVERRDERISELETAVKQLQETVSILEDKLENKNSTDDGLHHETGWEGIDPTE